MNKKTAMWGLKILLVLLVLRAFYWLQIQDDFYASAIPNDPVHMGMSPSQVKTVLGEPDEIHVLEAFVGRNNEEMRPTGETIYEYLQPVFGQNVRLKYHYYKWKNRVEEMRAYVGSYATLPEAMAIAGQAVGYAHTAFAKKGDYTFEDRGNLTYRFSVQKQNHIFLLEVSVQYYEGIDLPYSVNLYQSLTRL